MDSQNVLYSNSVNNDDIITFDFYSFLTSFYIIYAQNKSFTLELYTFASISLNIYSLTLSHLTQKVFHSLQ